jgi:hypothetical protein
MPSVTYNPNTCSSNGSYVYTPGPNGAPPPPDTSNCGPAVAKAAASMATCSLSTAAAVGSGGLAGAVAVVSCVKAANDGVDAMHACGY